MLRLPFSFPCHDVNVLWPPLQLEFPFDLNVYSVLTISDIIAPEKQVDVDARDDHGNTALLYAARFFIDDRSRGNGWALLGKGADVNAANDRGETALILAATLGKPDSAQLLLQKGANVNAKTRTGRTALMQAIDEPEGFDNVHHVGYSPQMAKLLIAAGADVNAHDADGNTALKLALSRGYKDMAAILKRAGAKE